ncbi:hypothetical protein QJS04_geneDACA003029 [Acorus gramineus]|uniref:Serine aminopeptidase S33 domain-containing protein n=1 Tax=Acorus gramineus TaxID=55184 RepID=A0AAV9BTD5_ACOGR|nr:hypothetical protein QJS04_geneDACA003029 [Acorus gramineus]
MCSPFSFFEKSFRLTLQNLYSDSSEMERSLHHHPSPPSVPLPIRSDTPIGRSRAILHLRAPNPVRPMRIVAAAVKKRSIDGATEEMNAIASEAMDFAPTRRAARAAFADTQLHLDHCLFRMAPPGIRTEERYEKDSRGVEIFGKSWLPRYGVPIKGHLCFCHGYGDTCTFFFEGIARRIAAAGYGVHALDYPGFGLSEGLHGYIPSFDGMVDHIVEHYSTLKEREGKKLPWFLLGQSMGGAVALKVHLKQLRDWDGIILVAPMCKAEYNVISYSDQMRLKTAVELLKATRDVESQLEKVSSPLLILHGAADKVTDPHVSKFLYDKACSTDKTLKLYEDGYHSILEGEPDGRIMSVIDDIILWLDDHSSTKALWHGRNDALFHGSIVPAHRIWENAKAFIAAWGCFYGGASSVGGLIEQNQQQARQILIDNPSLTRALFQAQIMLGMVKPPQVVPNVQPTLSQHPQQSSQTSEPTQPLPVQAGSQGQMSSSQPQLPARQQYPSQASVPSSLPPINIQSQVTVSHPLQSAQQSKGSNQPSGIGTPFPQGQPPLPNMTQQFHQLTPEMEKALLQQVMSLTPEQINLLPPEQRQQVLHLQQMLR